MLRYYYNDAVPNAFPNRVWGASYNQLRTSMSHEATDFFLHTEAYDHPVDQTRREGDYWYWRGNPGYRLFGDLAVVGTTYCHWISYLKQYIEAVPP